VRTKFGAFIRLSRLKFLMGGFVGGGFGTAMAAYEHGSVSWSLYALAQWTITAFHLMTHYANDYFDRHADARTVPTPYSGGSGVLVDGSLAPSVALCAALVCATVGACGILTLATVAGRPAAALIGCAIAFLAWSYSAPPLRLLARGLGEANTALVVAILVPCCAFAAQGTLPDGRALASMLPGAAAMFAMMLSVEFPDFGADGAGGKANLLVRLGVARGRRLAIVCVGSVYGALGLALFVGAPPALVLVEALSLPLALRLAWSFARRGEGDYRFDEALAARGVAFFFIVTFYGLLAYGAAPHARGNASATNVTAGAVLPA
jgi:1,4-dihydroxy-2-naphthoate octaprenyltransferase